MFDSLKERTRHFIGRRRQSVSIRALHQLATFVEEAYENNEWDMCVNGETTLLQRLTSVPFATMFDVGAHVGDWSVEALAAWPGSHVHIFEVAPPTFDRLKQRFDAAGLSVRSTLNCAGLSDTTSSREMYYFPDHPKLTCDMARHAAYRATPFGAHLVKGDAYVEQHGIAAIDFLKIDVEGAEHLVLKGLQRTMKDGRIHCIQFEYGAFSIQTRVLLADYYEMLSPMYWIGKIFPAGVEFRDYDWTMECFRFSNFLCVSRNRPDLKELTEASRADVAALRLQPQTDPVAATSEASLRRV
jgi:FkbM family methyltransferase